MRNFWSQGTLIAVILTLTLLGLVGCQGSTKYTLNVAVYPIDGGSVSPSDDKYGEGTEVTLIASPAEGYIFDCWSGEISGTSGTCTLVMDADRSGTAHFVRQYTLSTDVSPEEGGSISPSEGTFKAGTEVTLTAIPAKGYAFDRWGGDVSGRADECTIVMDADRTVTAHFTDQYTLSTKVLPEEAGSITPSEGKYAAGTELRLVAIPTNGCIFDHWSGDVSGSSDACTFVMDADRAVTAHFIKKYTLSTDVSPEGAGSIIPSEGKYDSGTEVSLTAVPTNGYALDHWGGGVSCNSNVCTCVMDADQAITAYFSKQYYSLSTEVSPEDGGTISPSEGTFKAGTEVTLTATPAKGYVLDHWGGDASCTSNECTVMMDADRAVTATFIREYLLYTSTDISSPGG
ncbi:MAG: InlB B-repeat-containing protein [Dehalococcoidia bacterium]